MCILRPTICQLRTSSQENQKQSFTAIRLRLSQGVVLDEKGRWVLKQGLEDWWVWALFDPQPPQGGQWAETQQVDAQSVAVSIT